jgi:hypothetical protein
MLLLRLHLRTLRYISAHSPTYSALRHYFHVPPRVPLIDHLSETDHGQADVVLALLRLNTPDSLRFAEIMVGHAIVRCPPCLLGRNRQAPRRPQWIITQVARDNPRVEPLARLRFNEFRVGRTEEQLLARGILRREISWLKKRGWITVEHRA